MSESTFQVLTRKIYAIPIEGGRWFIAEKFTFATGLMKQRGNVSVMAVINYKQP